MDSDSSDPDSYSNSDSDSVSPYLYHQIGFLMAQNDYINLR